MVWTMKERLQDDGLDWVGLQYFYAPTPYLCYSGRQTQTLVHHSRPSGCDSYVSRISTRLKDSMLYSEIWLASKGGSLGSSG